MLQKRTNILLNQEMWNKLARLAEEMKTSVGDLIRSAVDKMYFNSDRDRQIREACEEIKRIRVHAKGRVDYKALINMGRKY